MASLYPGMTLPSGKINAGAPEILSLLPSFIFSSMTEVSQVGLGRDLFSKASSKSLRDFSQTMAFDFS